MRIAYVLSHDIDKNDGVVKKIIDQSRIWQSLGHKVEIYTICNSNGKSELASKTYPFSGALKSRLLINKDLYRDVCLFNPDIVYFRYDFWNATVNALGKKFKLIIESNTASKREALLQIKTQRNLKALLRYTSIFIFDDILTKKIKGVVSVTDEIYQLEYQNSDIPHTTITNSVSLENYSVLKQQKDDDIHLCFLGSPNQPWQGEDIIEELALKMPEYTFHIIGSDGINKQNVFFHGYLQKSNYQEILKKCSIAIGTMALERKGISQACPLKVREYLLGGFPIIIGYDDVVNDDSPSWCLKISDTSDEEIRKIRKFVKNNKNYIVPRESLSSISLDQNESRRMKFFQKVKNNNA